MYIIILNVQKIILLKKKVYNIFPFQLLNKESSDLNTTRDNTKKKIIKSKIKKKML